MEQTAALVCPKCGSARSDGAAACAKCGLATSRMAEFANDPQIVVPQQLVAAWDRAVEKWDDPAAHDEVLRLAGVHDSFAWVAGRYRTRPEDKIRDAQLERLRKAAEVTMYATAAQRPEKTSQRYRGLAVIVVMIALASALLYLIVRMRSNDEPMPTAPTIEKKKG